MKPQLEAHIKKNKGDYSLRQIDLDKPGNQQGSQEFQFKYIPHLLAYNETGKLLANGKDEVLKLIKFK